MKLNIYTTILAGGLMILISSCSKMLDEKPYTFIAGENLVQNKEYAQLVAGAYNTLHYSFQWGNYHNIVNFDCDYQSGPVWAFGTIGAGNFFEDGSNYEFYRNYYKSIHRANYHKYLISQMKIDDKIKANALGELSFLKAWSYFNLVQLYGDLCLYKTSISDGADIYLPRTPVKDVYDYIIEELKFAEKSLYSVKDKDYKIGHVSSGAAKALLAKVYATIGSASMKSGNISVLGGPGFRNDDQGYKVRIPVPAKLTFPKSQVAGYESFNSDEYFKLAMDKAKELIDLGDFDLYPSQQELWTSANRNRVEFIFSLQTLAGDDLMSNYVATDYAGYYAADGTLTSGYYVQRDHWFQLFDETDDRINWGVVHRVPFYFDSSSSYMYYCYYPARDSTKVRLGLEGYQPTDMLRYDAHLYGSKLMKFRAISTPLNGERSDFHWPFIRYAEVLLLYAEAANEVNNGPSSEVINQVERLNIRNKSAKVSDLAKSVPWNKESFRSYILEERAKEFAAEGIRKFDLLRWGIYLQTMNAIDVDENDVIKRRESRHLLMPLPANEVNTNPYIDKNNPGW